MKHFYRSYQTPIFFALFLMLGSGIFFYNKIQVSLFPEITFPRIKIIADNGEQPVKKMMIVVTKPIENAVIKVPFLKSIRSITSRGSCEISILLDWKANIYTAQQQVESRIAEIKNSLPKNTHITVERMNPSIFPVMGFSIESKTKSLIELKLLSEYTIKPFLSQIAGVSSIQVQGGKNKEFWIVLQTNKMSNLGVTPKMIANTIKNANFILANGYVNNYRRLYLTITNSGIYNKKDIENLVIQTNTNRRDITIKDVSTVKIKQQVEYIKINANGNEGVLVNVLKQPNANLANINNSIQAKLPELKKLLPKDVKIVPYYNQSNFVSNSIKSVRDALWIGLALAIFFTMIFLKQLKPSLSILLIIPITLSLSISIMYFFNYTLNIMTLGAIAASIGLIIDDAVVIVEQIFRIQEEEPQTPIFTIIKKAMTYLFPAMIGSSLSTILVFLPFSLMGGVAGAYFKVLAYTMIIVLTCSFFVTAIGLPILYAKLFYLLPKTMSKPVIIKEKKWVNYFIHHPIYSISFVGILLICGIYIIPKLATGFLPEMDEGAIVLDYKSPPGTSIHETNLILNKVDKILATIPEIKSYSRRTGTQMGFFITEPNKGDYLISLYNKRKVSTEKIIDEIRTKIAHQIPVLQIDCGQVISDMLGDLISSVQPIEIKIFGTDEDKLKNYAKKIASIVKKIKGTADVFDGIVIAGPNIDIKPNLKALHHFNLTQKDLQYQLQTQLQGIIVGNVQEKEQLSNIRMIYPNATHQNINRIKKTAIFLKSGKQIPVSQLAKITIKKGVSELERENIQAIVIVTARLNNRDLGSTMKDIKQQINKEIHFPLGYGINYGGAYAEQHASFKDLMTILILAIVLVLLVLLFLFRNFSAALIILFISVLGIAGSLLALYLTKTPLNVGSYTGIIMIVGIIAENAIFTYFQFTKNLKFDNKENSINFAISTRLRPKLMTAFSAIIALTPLALGVGTGAQMHQPLAISVIGGFIVALPLLLIVLPTLIWKTKKIT